MNNSLKIPTPPYKKFFTVFLLICYLGHYSGTTLYSSMLLRAFLSIFHPKVTENLGKVGSLSPVQHPVKLEPKTF